MSQTIHTQGALDLVDLCDQNFYRRMRVNLLGKVQTSPSDPMSEVMARVDEIDRRIAAEVDAMQKDLFRAMDMIDALEDSRERQVLTLFFLNPTVNLMEDVADLMHYSIQHIYRIYKSAIANCSSIVNDESKCESDL